MTPAQLARFEKDPVAFCREVLDMEVPAWQAEVMLAMWRGGTVFIGGRRGGRKDLLERLKQMAQKRESKCVDDS